MELKTWLLVAMMVWFSLKPHYNRQTSSTGNYKLVWADELNTTGSVDTANWRFEHGFQRNHEDQWYQRENAVCKNGLLVIKAKKVNKLNPDYQIGSNNWKTNRKYIHYTSASLNTRGLHHWQYGRFIMRARIDTDPGLWPAFWTLGEEGEWPSNGEIDIMEYYRKMLLANIATGTATRYTAKWFSIKKPIKNFKNNWSKGFHIWRMDWDENNISLYVDDQLLNSVDLSALVNQDGTGVNPFKQPHYILVNLAVGGDNGGDPRLTRFPKPYEIDYIRVYQK